MVLEHVIPNEISQRRQLPYDFTHTWNLKNKMNEQSKQKRVRRYIERVGDRRAGVGGQGEGLPASYRGAQGVQSTARGTASITLVLTWRRMGARLIRDHFARYITSPAFFGL